MSRRAVKRGIPVSNQAPGFPSPVVSRVPVTTGLEYALDFQFRSIGVPTVPLPARSSLGQMLERYRLQRSHYVSAFRLGLQSEIGYPSARGQTILNSAPPLTSRPRPVGNGMATAKPGAMRPPPRWRKALPVPVVPFDPPTYGAS